MLPEKTKEAIKKAIFDGFGIDEEDYKSWTMKRYPVDKEVLSRFQELIKGADKIRIYGDYDCDGITASYIMSELVSDLTKKEAIVKIPGRFSDGYGISEKSIDRFYEEDKNDIKAGKNVLIITVDNGIAAYDAIKKAKDYGYSVLLTDHHELGENTLPPADLLIDPKVDGINPFEFNDYCGAGIAAKLYKEIFYDTSLREKTRTISVYSSIATIADHVSLTEDNYITVRSSMERLRNGLISASLSFLGDKNNVDWGKISVNSLSFDVIPLLNAPGRLSDDGGQRVFSYLKNPDPETAELIFEENEERKKQRADAVKEAEASFDKTKVKEGFLTPQFIYVPDTAPGIIGLSAASIVDKHKEPCILLSDKEGPLRGSGRSVNGFDLFSYLLSVKASHPEWFLELGGHEGACGMTMNKEYLSDILAFSKDFPVREEEKKERPSIPIREEDVPDAFSYVDSFYPVPEDAQPYFTVHVRKNEKGLYFYNNGSFYLPRKDYRIESWNRYVPETDIMVLTGPIKIDGFRGKPVPVLKAKTAEEYHPIERDIVKEDVRKNKEEADNEFHAPLEDGTPDYSAD